MVSLRQSALFFNGNVAGERDEIESEGFKVNGIARGVSHTMVPQTFVESMDGKVENVSQGPSDMRVTCGERDAKKKENKMTETSWRRSCLEV